VNAEVCNATSRQVLLVAHLPCLLSLSSPPLSQLPSPIPYQAAKTGIKAVDMGSLEFARDRIIMGAERKSAVISDKSRR